VNNAIRRTLAGTAGIVALTFAAYWPAMHGEFLWDDDDHVTQNKELRSGEGLRRIWFEPGATMQHYPLTFTAWWLQYHLWGPNPSGYHVVNVALHALNAVLLWRLLLRLRVRGAWLAGAAFALHPVHVMSVAWITELKNVLSGAFFLGALLAYLRFSGAEQRRQDGRFYWLALGLYVLALLSKTSTALLPVSLLLLLWWKRERLARNDLLPLVPLVLLGAALASVTIWVEKLKGAQGAEFSLSFAERWIVMGRAFWFNLGKLIWPAELTFIYPRWQIDPGAVWQWLFPLATGALLAAFWLARNRLGRAPLAATMHFLVASPALVLVHVLYMMRYSFVTDHWQYLGSMSVIALLVGAVAGAGQAHAQRVPAVAARCAAMLLIAGLGVLTWRQAHIYKDLETLYQDTLAKNPASWMPHNNLGTILYHRGRVDAAIRHYQEALRLKPDSTDAHANLGLALASQGRVAEAAAHYHEALRIKPDFAQAHANFGHLLIQQGKVDEGIRHLLRSLQARPDFADTHFRLGEALEAKGQAARAAAAYANAVRLRPDWAEARHNLGIALETQGRTEEAIREYAEAVTIDPKFAEAHNSLGLALVAKGDLDRAHKHHSEAVRLRPGVGAFHNNLALVLTAQGRADDAIREFIEAVRLDPNLVEVRLNLADLLARRGRFDEALDQLRAVEHLRPAMKDQIGARIEAIEAMRRGQGG